MWGKHRICRSVPFRGRTGERDTTRGNKHITIFVAKMSHNVSGLSYPMSHITVTVL